MAGRTIGLARGEALVDALKSCKVLHAKKKLPGVVIFVHGVNSDGEWYDAAEAGLCAGLNTRMRRGDAQCAYPEHVGKLAPASYRPELTPRGFIDRKLTADDFVAPGPNDSPVIRFRWGYRATKEEKDRYGPGISLNEDDAWGGGPFANGCSALADCWGAGLDDTLFGWITAQSLNPTPNRLVYACPPRAYYAHAAWRLARLVALVRKHQEDVPVTILAHSQGTMIAMASAFIGEVRLGGAGVADTYHLVNSPFNLSMGRALERAFDNHAQRGRVTDDARLATLRRFLAIVGKRAGGAQHAALVDQLTLHPSPVDGSPGCTVAGEHASDRDHHGRVFVHCNPHDQVISAFTVQGIGWKGISDAERRALGAAAAHLRQRVWAHGTAVPGAGTPWRVGAGRIGGARPYHFWRNHWRPAARPGRNNFWHPPSPIARYRWDTVGDPRRSVPGAIASALSGPVLEALRPLVKAPVNAEPPADWTVLDDAPPVPEPIVPTLRGDAPFDGGREPEHAAFAPVSPVTDADDPYNAARREQLAPFVPEMRGTAGEEAGLRYEHHARVRMEARAKGGEHARMADRLNGEDTAAEAFFREQGYDARRIAWVLNGRDVAATDHSSILTNPEHAEKVFAWDLPLGYVAFEDPDRPTPSEDDVWRMLRRVAHWRWIGAATDAPSELQSYRTYYHDATIKEVDLENHDECGRDMPRELGIDDRRETYGPDDDPWPRRR